MSETRLQQPPAIRRRRVTWVLLLAMALVTARSSFVAARDRGSDAVADGFAEPYRTIDLAAPEMGVVTAVHVREGDFVEAGQIVATLDQDLYRAQLAIAEKTVEFQGALNSATAELALRRQRLEKLERLSQQGFARPEEIERARADVEIGEANLLAVMEERQLKMLEVERIKVQVERRNIRTRSTGVVTKVHRDVGEFVPPNDPVVVTIVQLHPLALSLSLPRAQAMQLRLNQVVTVVFEATQTPTAAIVEYLSPTTDAESGTVAVRLKIDNSEGRFRSGDRCVLDMRSVPPAAPPKTAATLGSAR